MNKGNDDAVVKMLDHGGQQEDNKKKYMIGGGIGVLIILVIILVVAISSGKSSTDTDEEDGGNAGPPKPSMIEILEMKPDLSKYAKDGENDKFIKLWWEDKSYGGSILDSIRKHDGNVKVPNSLRKTIQEMEEKAGEFSGRFRFENQKVTDTLLYDIDIFVDAGN